MRLVTGTGEVLEIDEEPPELLNAARVSPGALGSISTLTLQCVPRFRLRAREARDRLDQERRLANASTGEVLGS